MYLQRTSTLPKPQGPLSRAMPSLSVAAANEEVKQVLGEGKKSDNPIVTSKRSLYQHFTPEEKLQIRKRAAECGVTECGVTECGVTECGVTASIRYFSGLSQFSGRPWLHVTTCRPRPIRESFLREIGNLPETRKFCPTKVSRYTVFC